MRRQRLVTDPVAVDALIRRLHANVDESPRLARPSVSPSDLPRSINVMRFRDRSDAIGLDALVETRLAPAGLVIYCFVNGEFAWSRACGDGQELYDELTRVKADFGRRGWREV